MPQTCAHAGAHGAEHVVAAELGDARRADAQAADRVLLAGAVDDLVGLGTTDVFAALPSRSYVTPTGWPARSPISSGMCEK